MKGLLLDTNVVSELRKPESKRNPQVTEWARGKDFRNSYLSVITITELKVGILRAKRRDLIQSEILRKWLESNILDNYKGRILNIDTEIAQYAAALQVPDKHQLADAYIAATALAHKLTLATRNVEDFLDTGVQIENPWEPGNTLLKLSEDYGQGEYPDE